jgi:hypothetical protein
MKNYDSSWGRPRWPLMTGVLALLALTTFVFAVPVQAQPYSINWHKVAGGGGMNSTSATYSVSGTVGQHDAGGPLVGGGYQLTGGFWAIDSVMQTPGAPILYITHSGATVIVFWQAVPVWILQQNNNLLNPSGWTASSGVTTSGGTNYLNLISPPGNLYFRLYYP